LIGSEAVVGQLSEKEFELVNKSGKTVRDGSSLSAAICQNFRQ